MVASVFQSRAHSPVLSSHALAAFQRNPTEPQSLRARASSSVIPPADVTTDMADVKPPLLAFDSVVVQNITPTEGLTCGGQDVTIHGRGFRPDMVVMFGDQMALHVTPWGEKVICCQTPPSMGGHSGAVPVRVLSNAMDMYSTPPNAENLAVHFVYHHPQRQQQRPDQAQLGQAQLMELSAMPFPGTMDDWTSADNAANTWLAQNTSPLQHRTLAHRAQQSHLVQAPPVSAPDPGAVAMYQAGMLPGPSRPLTNGQHPQLLVGPGGYTGDINEDFPTFTVGQHPTDLGMGW
jgi:hypothetical protein